MLYTKTVIIFSLLATFTKYGHCNYDVVFPFISIKVSISLIGKIQPAKQTTQYNYVICQIKILIVYYHLHYPHKHYLGQNIFAYKT